MKGVAAMYINFRTRGPRVEPADPRNHDMATVMRQIRSILLDVRNILDE